MATLEYGVNFLNYLSQQLADLDGIATLAHDLIQNADDAKDDAGELAATRITFDIRDDALLVSNDAVFREEDFERLREVASASKRSEAGARTTGAFGVGFISVYQITDRPEICSAGRHWTLRPEAQEIDEDHSENNGTVFWLPWAFEESPVCKGLRKPPVSKDSIDSFAKDLKESLPRAMLFLKKLDTIRLLRNGNSVICIKRAVSRNTTKISCDGVIQTWHFVEGSFSSEASELKREYSPDYIEDNRSDRVRVAIPDSLRNDGLLFATLPTRQSTGLPFHIDADFFPDTDRKSIVFGDTRRRDHRSEWNRAAIRAAVDAVGDNLLTLRDTFRDDALTFWGILERLRRVHNEQSDDTRISLGAFWERLSPSLSSSPIVYTESGQWVTPAQVYIPTGAEKKEAVSAFGALGIEMAHRDLLEYHNILRSIGIGVLRIEHIHGALQKIGMVGRIRSDNPLPAGTLELLWKGVDGVLDNTQERTKPEATRLLKQCALAPGVDGRLWPCGRVYRADDSTRKLFAPLMSCNAASFLAERGMKVPLLQRLCPKFRPDSAIKELERPEAQWRAGRFDPADLLRWFDSCNRKTRLAEDLRERLAQLPIFPSEGGHLRPGSLVYRADAPTRRLFAPLMGHAAAPFLAERVMDISLLGELCLQFTPSSAIEELECLEAQDLQAKRRDGFFDPATLLRWFDNSKSHLDQSLCKRLAQLPIFPSAKNLHPLENLRLPGGFDDPIGVAKLLNMETLNGLTDFLHQWLDARDLTFPDYARNYIPDAFAADRAVSREDKRKLLDILAERIGSIWDDQEVRDRLTAAHIVECAGGVFRQPEKVISQMKR